MRSLLVSIQVAQLERKRQTQIDSGGIPDEAKHTEDVRRVHEAYQFLAQKYLGRLKRKEEDQGPN